MRVTFLGTGTSVGVSAGDAAGGGASASRRRAASNETTLSLAGSGASCGGSLVVGAAGAASASSPKSRGVPSGLNFRRSVIRNPLSFSSAIASLSDGQEFNSHSRPAMLTKANGSWQKVSAQK